MYYFLKPNLILKESEIEAISILNFSYNGEAKNELLVVYDIYMKSRERFGSEIVCGYPEFDKLVLMLDTEKRILSNLIDKLAIEAKNKEKNIIDFVNCLESATDKAINEMQNEDSQI